MTKKEREQMLAEKLEQMKKYERDLNTEGVSFIAGVDEVGRGPLAGPVVTAAVILPVDFDVLGVDDSKKLSDRKRRELDVLIREKALAYGFGMRDNETIDRINILNATKEAMKDAVEEAADMLRIKHHEELQHVLIDAVRLDGLNYPETPLVKGDQKSISIAAASIIAKVKRDDMMIAYASKYPGYAFEKNKGYGTREHYEGIREHGITPVHRRSFLKNIIDQES
ncbi:MAG: ribonuclease HII [Eubacterium sp.]|nr:ribonuclease HII [Eubacterium sp.]